MKFLAFRQVGDYLIGFEVEAKDGDDLVDKIVRIEEEYLEKLEEKSRGELKKLQDALGCSTSIC